MIEFNSDGSIKIPDNIAEEKKDNENRLKTQRCIQIRKKVINFGSPKKCLLNIKISDVVNDTSFIQKIHGSFCENSKVPTKLNKLNEKEFEIEIGTDFKRCTDCKSLVYRYRSFLEVIEDKGNCTFEERSFCYEDYFD